MLLALVELLEADLLGKVFIPLQEVLHEIERLLAILIIGFLRGCRASTAFFNRGTLSNALVRLGRQLKSRTLY